MMEFKVNQNNKSYGGETSTLVDPSDFNDSFEDWAEAQLFEELTNDEGGDAEGAESADSGGTDSGTSGGNSSNNGQSGGGSSNGQQRILAYWAAKKEAEDGGQEVLSVNGRSASSSAASAEEAALSSSEIPLLELTAEEQAELERAAESFDALAFLQDDEESADWHGDDASDLKQGSQLADHDLTAEASPAQETDVMQMAEDELAQAPDVQTIEQASEQQNAEWVDVEPAFEDRIQGDSAGEIAMGVVTNNSRDGESQQRRSRGHVELTLELLDATTGSKNGSALSERSESQETLTRLSPEQAAASAVDDSLADDQSVTLPDTSQWKATEREDLAQDMSRFEEIALESEAQVEGEIERSQTREAGIEASAQLMEEDVSQSAAEASELATEGAELALEQGIDGDTGAEALTTGQYLSSNHDHGGDSRQGRSRGEYIVIDEDQAAEEAIQPQKRMGNKEPAEAQRGASPVESGEPLHERMAEIAAEKKALTAHELQLMRMEEMLAHYFTQREQAKIEQQRQEMLDALQQFQNRLNGLTQMAGHQGFMGALMLMGFGGGFALSPTVDRRGLMLEKPKENLKGAGSKGDSKKATSPEVGMPDTPEALEDIDYKMPSAEDNISLSHDDLMAARKEAFRERFGQWLATLDEALGDEDDQMFIAHMLQSYDQFSISGSDDAVALQVLWLSAMELINPPDLVSLCEAVVGQDLPDLRAQLSRCLQGTPLLSQNSRGDIAFEAPVLAAVTDVSTQLLDNSSDHFAAKSPSEALAIIAKQLQLPLVVVSFDGNAYTLLTPAMKSEALWCELQVWDIDWAEQRNLILMEGEGFRFLRRQF